MGALLEPAGAFCWALPHLMPWQLYQWAQNFPLSGWGYDYRLFCITCLDKTVARNPLLRPACSRRWNLDGSSVVVCLSPTPQNFSLIMASFILQILLLLQWGQWVNAYYNSVLIEIQAVTQRALLSPSVMVSLCDYCSTSFLPLPWQSDSDVQFSCYKRCSSGCPALPARGKEIEEFCWVKTIEYSSLKCRSRLSIYSC